MIVISLMGFLFWRGRGGRGGSGWEITYGEGEEAETEEDAGVADEREDVHLVG